MKLRKMCLPIFVILLLMLAGVGLATWGDVEISSVKINSVVPSNGTVTDSTNTLSISVSNASICNLTYKSSARNVSITTSEMKCTGGSAATLAGTETTNATISCEVYGLGDSYTTWYYSCATDTSTVVSTDNYQIKLEGESDEDEAGNGVDGIITRFTNITQKQKTMYIIVLLALTVFVVVGIYWYVNRKK